MSEALTKLDQADGVATLTLDRAAKRNALSRALRHELVARLAHPPALGVRTPGPDPHDRQRRRSPSGSELQHVLESRLG